MSPETNIFGVYRLPIRFLVSNPVIRHLFLVFWAFVICSMVFRVYWLFWQIDSDQDTLKFGWAESKMFGFISAESFAVSIAIWKTVYFKSVGQFEKNLGALKMLRVSPFHKKHDDFRILWTRIGVTQTFSFCALVLTSIYLVVHHLTTFGEVKKSSWYWKVDPIIAILCAISNFIYLPLHSLRHHAISREFEVFNDEMEQFSSDKKLANLQNLRTFAARQRKLFEFANANTVRTDKLMIWAPCFSLIALLMGTYIITKFSKIPTTLYLICIIAVSASTFIMSFILLYPVAFVQDSMDKAASILLNDDLLQTSDDQLVYCTYRILIDRCTINRVTNNVLRLFSVTLKNIERVFFFHWVVTICMILVYSFQDGLEEGFGDIVKILEAFETKLKGLL